MGLRVSLYSALLLTLTGGAAAEPYKLDAGPFPVEVHQGEWLDAAREDRQVPWKLYLAQADQAVPVVIFSHGLGGSREGGAYLGRHLASHGYAAFHIQHPGTDASLIQGDGVQGVLKRGRDPRAALARYGDVGFAVAMIKAMNVGVAFKDRLQVTAMGISGHSFGALTTLIAAGANNRVIGQRFAVPALRGAFALSPAARGGEPQALFRNMLMPIFHVTGTRDGSPLGDLEPPDRLLPFQHISNVDQYLLVLDDAVHATFSGRQTTADPQLVRHHELVRMAAVAFWDETLRNSEAARHWLRNGGLAGELAAGDVFEFKVRID